MVGKTFLFAGHQCRHPDHALPAAVRRRDGQVGATRPAHLVAGRDGRPDAGLRPDPCRDHGDGGRVPRLPLLAAVRARARGARVRHLHRRYHGVLRRFRRPLPERHQAGHRLFDLLAARLHVRGGRRVRLWRGHVPPLHARLLQGAAVPCRRLGHPRHAPRAGHAQNGRPRTGNSLHLGDDADRQSGADRRRHSGPAARPRRFLFQGRDHQRGLSASHTGIGDLRLYPDVGRGGHDLASIPGASS